MNKGTGNFTYLLMYLCPLGDRLEDALASTPIAI